MKKQLRFATKEEKLSYYMIVISCVCMLLNFYGIPHKMTKMISLSNRVMLVIWIIVAGFMVIRRFLRRTPKPFGPFWLTLVFSAFSLLMAGAGKITSNIITLFNFLALPIMLMYGCNFAVSTKVKPVLLLTNVVASFVFISLYHSNLRYAFDTYYGVRYIDNVTLGYPNPNQTAMYLFVCVINLVVAFYYYKKTLQRIFLCVDAIYILWILYQTDSRTAMLLMIVFFAWLVISRAKKVSPATVNIILMIPLLYALLAQFLFPYFEEFVIFGESLFNGRENIYDRYFDNLSLSSFVFGDFNRFRFQNLHNGYVSIAATAGVVVLVSFIVLFWNVLKSILDGAEFKAYEKTALIGLLCLFVYTSTEAALLVGSVNYAYLVFTPFLLCSIPDSAEKQNQIEGSN